MPNEYDGDEEKFKKCDQLLTGIEKILRAFIEREGLLPYLIDDTNWWDWSKNNINLYNKGLGEYTFEKNYHEWPGRSIHWKNQGGLYCLLNIYAAEDMRTFDLWALVCFRPTGFPEPGTFQQRTSINLPMEDEGLIRLLEENYNFICEKGAIIKSQRAKH